MQHEVHLKQEEEAKQVRAIEMGLDSTSGLCPNLLNFKIGETANLKI